MAEKTEFCADQSMKLAGEASSIGNTGASDSLRDRDDLLGMRVRERMKQDGIDHAENCGAGGDPQAERDHRDNGEGRGL